MGFWSDLLMVLWTDWLSGGSYDEDFFRICSHGTAEEVMYELASGKSARAKDKNGKTALMYAAENNSDEEVLSVLINAGANISARTARGSSALHFAADNMSCNPKIIDVLIRAGIDVNSRGNEYKTPLMYAVSTHFDNSRNIKALISAGADVEAECYVRRTTEELVIKKFLSVLMLAIYSNNVENVRAVIEAGADVNEQTFSFVRVRPKWYERGNRMFDEPLVISVTPLIAAVNKKSGILELLLDAGAEINTRDREGYTALGYARGLVPDFPGNEETARILEARGARLSLHEKYRKEQG